MKIFIVDDNEDFCVLQSYYLSQNEAFEISSYNNGKSLLKALSKEPQLILLDYYLPDYNGKDLMKLIKEKSPTSEVILVSGQEDVSLAIQLLKEGAYDYIEKNENTHKRLWTITNHFYKTYSLEQKNKELQKQLNEKDNRSSIIGNCNSLQQTLNIANKSAKTNINIWITGETGTGKELLASYIHNNSKLEKKPFIAVNISAIPKELIESELFGHKKGAFTGAVNDRIGKFEEADGGTLFLDEIAEMDISLQAKLLRVIQEKEITRLGENKTRKINFRLVVATHQDLKKLVIEKKFREDLYYRLMGVKIELPPLRKRGSDIILLSQHFIKSFASENDMETKTLSDASKQKLLNYPFPGNIRELKSIIDLAMVLSEEKIINDNHIQLEISDEPHRSIINNPNEKKTLKQYTREIVQHYLNANDGNIEKVAELLDIGKSSIYRMIKENEISR